MQGLAALIERLALDRDLRNRPDLLTVEGGPEAPGVGALAARLAVGTDVTPSTVNEDQAFGARLPAGVRIGRLAFSPVMQEALAAGEASVPAELFRLPVTREALMGFFAERTGLGGGAQAPEVSPNTEAALQRFYGLSIGDVARDCLALRDQDGTAYTLLLSLEFDPAIARMPGIADAHPHYPRLARGLLDALLILAELERLRDIVASLAGQLAGASVSATNKRPTSRDLVRLLLGEAPADALDDAAINAFLADTPFHTQTLLWQVAAGPGSIDPGDELLAILAERRHAPPAARFPEGRKRLGGLLKDARAMRPNAAGKTMPVALARYMGLDLLDTATLGLIEIAGGTARLNNGREGKNTRMTRTGAFWTLLMALLGSVAPHAVEDADRLSLRGPAGSIHKGPGDIDKGEARLRRASGSHGLIHAYLPPADTPLGAARFVPRHWLGRDRHFAWSRRIVRDFRGGAHGGLFDALPSAWKPAILVRIAALRRTLRSIEEQVGAMAEADEDLAARALAALLSAVTPLSSDPLLHFVLERHRKQRPAEWLDGRIAALRVVRSEQDPET